MPKRLANRILRLAAAAFDSLGSGTFLARDSADQSIKVVYQEAGDAIADVTLLDTNQKIPSSLLASTPTHGSSHRIGGSDASSDAVVEPASPYAVAAGVRRILLAASTTIQLPSSNINVGEQIEIVNTSASSITVTLDPQDADNLDGAAANVNITVAAHSACGALRRAAADWRSVQLASTDLTGPRAIYISVEGGVLGWKEQVLVGSTWTDVSAHVALSVDVDGGVTFSGTTYTIPLILAATTTPNLADDKRYVAFTSCSAELQAMVASGNYWSVELGYGSMDAVINARIGVAVVRTAGTAFDATSENDSAARIGWTGATYQMTLTGGTAAWGNAVNSALAVRISRWIGAGSLNMTVVRTGASAWTAQSIGNGLATVPDRLYVLACAAGVTVGPCNVSAPVVRLVFYPWYTFDA